MTGSQEAAERGRRAREYLASTGHVLGEWVSHWSGEWQCALCRQTFGQQDVMLRRLPPCEANGLRIEGDGDITVYPVLRSA